MYTMDFLSEINNLILSYLIKQCIPVLKGECNVFKKKILLWMKTIHYPNTIRSHLVTIVPMAPFTPKSTSKLRSALHIRYSKVIPLLTTTTMFIVTISCAQCLLLAIAHIIHY